MIYLTNPQLNDRSRPLDYIIVCQCRRNRLWPRLHSVWTSSRGSSRLIACLVSLGWSTQFDTSKLSLCLAHVFKDRQIIPNLFIVNFCLFMLIDYRNESIERGPISLNFSSAKNKVSVLIR